MIKFCDETVLSHNIIIFDNKTIQNKICLKYYVSLIYIYIYCTIVVKSLYKTKTSNYLFFPLERLNKIKFKQFNQVHSVMYRYFNDLSNVGN